MWPRITWKPKWGLTFAEIRSKVIGTCSISQRSTFAIKGRYVFLEDLSLDGAFLINSTEEAEVCYVEMNIEKNCILYMFAMIAEFTSFLSFVSNRTIECLSILDNIDYNFQFIVYFYKLSYITRNSRMTFIVGVILKFFCIFCSVDRIIIL